MLLIGLITSMFQRYLFIVFIIIDSFVRVVNSLFDISLFVNVYSIRFCFTAAMYILCETWQRLHLILSSMSETTVSSTVTKQGDHHNGDRAARQPHVLCSICFHSYGALVKAVLLFILSLHNQCILKCVRLTFSTTANRLAEIWRGGGFSTPSLGDVGGWAHSIVDTWSISYWVWVT